MITNDDILDLLATAVHSGAGVRLAVSGRSMGPAYSEVVDIQVVPCEPSSITPGRLVVFQRDGRWVVHRVMRRIGAGEDIAYLTKGDGLAQPDQPVVLAREVKGMVSGLGLKNGATVDLCMLASRIKAWWIVVRFRIRWINNAKGDWVWRSKPE